MSDSLRTRLYNELESLRLIDPHCHIEPLTATSSTLADILGYHYYTELVHSAGFPREQIEEPDLDPKEKVRRLVEHIDPLRNTIQFSWFTELSQEFFDLPAGEEINTGNWESLYDNAAKLMAQPDWEQQVLDLSHLDAMVLTNQFDDPLDGFDTSRYIPCLRTDDLVFHLDKSSVRQRLEKCTNTSLTDVSSLKNAIGKLFEHFTSHGCKACAISLPPDFTPHRIDSSNALISEAIDLAFARHLKNDGDVDESSRLTLAEYVFWTLAEYCAEYHLPFDLMIGVNRSVYEHGVFQGQDLFDSRISLIQYRELFNAFPQVTFPVSVLASVTNQELVSYSWIFPNVITNGHWWYSNTPTYIEHDAAARLEAIPSTKQIGYYSDMYKLEFALPKFRMYKRVLAKILAERFVLDRSWSEEKALDLGKKVLRGNVERIFKVG